MFKTQGRVLLIGLVVYIIYIAGFSLFASLSLGLMFYVAAILLFIGFFLYVSDFYPESEVSDMTEVPSDSARYRSDESYCITSIAAILLLLLSVTPQLVLLFMKQNGTFDSGWLIRVLAFFAGYLLLHLITAIYHIGTPSSVASLVSYNNAKSVREAKSILKDVLVDVLGLKEGDVDNSARLANDLGMTDLLDVIEILDKVDGILDYRYGRSLYCLAHWDRESTEMRRFINWNEKYYNESNRAKSENRSLDVDGFYNEFISIFPKFRDLAHFLGEAIERMRRS